ncbi:MAG: hypothetical protein AB7U43_10175 [Desulfobacter sp.]
MSSLQLRSAPRKWSSTSIADVAVKHHSAMSPVGKKFLLLQGPMGPFFRRLADDLLVAGAALVDKVNFNGGERYYFPAAIDYNGPLSEFGRFLNNLISKSSYDKIVLFGDTRPMHLIARQVAAEHGIKLVVFEEGYLRPHFITCEVGGVNGFSSIPRDPEFYRCFPVIKRHHQVGSGKKFNPLPFAWFHAWKYGYEMRKARPEFPHYQHNRVLTWREGFRWVGWTLKKKVLKRGSDKKKLDDFFVSNGKKFFVPLQVANDSQVTHHSRFISVAEFIEWCIGEFATHAPADACLLVKHHPLDPHNNYARLIRRAAKRFNCQERVCYVVEGHLPTILQRADGVLTINSTVGLSALHHGCPTCVAGESIYEMTGLATNDVKRFFAAPSLFRPDRELFARFKSYLILKNQAVGSFYLPLSRKRGETGLVWPQAVKISKRPALVKKKCIRKSNLLWQLIVAFAAAITLSQMLEDFWP